MAIKANAKKTIPFSDTITGDLKRFMLNKNEKAITKKAMLTRKFLSDTFVGIV